MRQSLLNINLLISTFSFTVLQLCREVQLKKCLLGSQFLLQAGHVCLSAIGNPLLVLLVSCGFFPSSFACVSWYCRMMLVDGFRGKKVRKTMYFLPLPGPGSTWVHGPCQWLRHWLCSQSQPCVVSGMPNTLSLLLYTVVVLWVNVNEGQLLTVLYLATSSKNVGFWPLIFTTE